MASLSNVLTAMAVAAGLCSLGTGCASTSADKEPHLSIETGNSLQIPLSELADARIVGRSGFVIKFRDNATLSVEPLSKEELGYSIDLHDYPKYLLGLADPRQLGSLDTHAVEDLEAARTLIDEELGSGREIVVFDTTRGHGYAALGDGYSVLFLIAKGNKDAITQIHASGMSRDAVRRVLIGGAR